MYLLVLPDMLALCCCFYFNEEARRAADHPAAAALQGCFCYSCARQESKMRGWATCCPHQRARASPSTRSKFSADNGDLAQVALQLLRVTGGSSWSIRVVVVIIGSTTPCRASHGAGQHHWGFGGMRRSMPQSKGDTQVNSPRFSVHNLPTLFTASPHGSPSRAWEACFESLTACATAACSASHPLTLPSNEQPAVRWCRWCEGKAGSCSCSCCLPLLASQQLAMLDA